MNSLNFQKIVDDLTAQAWPQEAQDELSNSSESVWLGKIVTAQKIPLSLSKLVDWISGNLMAAPQTLDNPTLVNKLFLLEHRIEELGTLANAIRAAITAANPPGLQLINLTIGEQTISIPRALLAARSPYFDRMLNSSFAEGVSAVPRPSIMLMESRDDAIAIQTLLSYLDNGEAASTQITLKNVAVLLQETDKYMLTSLHDTCQKWLISHIESHALLSELPDLLSLAQATNSSKLSACIENYVSNIERANKEIQAGFDKSGDVINQETWDLLEELGKYLTKLSILYSIFKFENVMDKCPNLRELELKARDRCDSEVKYLAETHPMLTKLVLHDAFNLTSITIEPIVINCSKLKILDIKYVRINEDDLRLIAQNLLSLRTLAYTTDYFRESTPITELGNLKKLRELTVRGINNFDNDAFRAVVENVNGLTTLDISDCYQLSGDLILYAAQKYKMTLKDFSFVLRDRPNEILPLLAIELENVVKRHAKVTP